MPEECYVAGEWEVGDDMKTPARNTSDLAQNPLADVARVLSDIARSLEAEPDLHHTAGGIAATVTRYGFRRGGRRGVAVRRRVTANRRGDQ